MFPLGQELILLVPAGDLNPNRSLWVFQNDTPPPLVSPEIIPVIELLFQPSLSRRVLFCTEVERTGTIQLSQPLRLL